MVIWAQRHFEVSLRIVIVIWCIYDVLCLIEGHRNRRYRLMRKQSLSCETLVWLDMGLMHQRKRVRVASEDLG